MTDQSEQIVLEAGLLLASGSPRRRELLEQVGLPHCVAPVPVDETPRRGEEAPAYVARLAAAKCQAAARVYGDWLAGSSQRAILAADTTVALDGKILGKPADDGQARIMLAELSDRTHEVMTALALRSASDTVSETVAVQVRFRALGQHEIEAYVQTGEGRDKAGSYGIQGIGGIFAEQINGSYSAVVGLPVASVETLLQALGIDSWRLRGYG